jgi:putative acetyltransferase
VIRAATARDVPAILDLHRASILALCKGPYSDEQLTQWTAPLSAELYAKLLATHQVLVQERGDELDGFGVLDLQSGLVNATYVAPSRAREGVGSALLAALEQQARARGLARLHLHATLNAIGFYAKLGYIQDGAATNRLPSGVELPCVRMHKQLPMP